MTMWKDTTATEPPKPIAQTFNAKAITEDELQAIVERLDATREIFRQMRELREVLSRRDAETRALNSRNAELEEMVRKFAPILLNAATAMGLAARNERADTRSQL
jgi:hypothetical protein